MAIAVQLSDEVRAAASEAVSIRRRIHENPEPGFQERTTHRLILDVLGKSKVPAKSMAGTGVVALVRGTKPGKTLLVRADIDCLPLTEENDVPYRSKRAGFMHA